MASRKAWQLHILLLFLPSKERNALQGGQKSPHDCHCKGDSSYTVGVEDAFRHFLACTCPLQQLWVSQSHPALLRTSEQCARTTCPPCWICGVWGGFLCLLWHPQCDLGLLCQVSQSPLSQAHFPNPLLDSSAWKYCLGEIPRLWNNIAKPFTLQLKWC